MLYPIPAILSAIVCLALLGGCTESGKDATYGTLARGVDEACERGDSALAIEARKEIVRQINGRTEVGNWTPSDCDGDGLPDFEIDADGLPATP